MQKTPNNTFDFYYLSLGISLSVGVLLLQLISPVFTTLSPMDNIDISNTNSINK